MGGICGGGTHAGRAAPLFRRDPPRRPSPEVAAYCASLGCRSAGRRPPRQRRQASATSPARSATGTTHDKVRELSHLYGGQAIPYRIHIALEKVLGVDHPDTRRAAEELADLDKPGPKDSP